MRWGNERGQAILLVAVASGIFLVGAIGLSVDAAQLYLHRQVAQTAADAAAEAGAMSIFGGTWNTSGFGTAGYTCTNGTDATSPCIYARSNGFGLSGSTDTVLIEFPSSVDSGVVLSSDPVFAHAAVRATITRNVPNSFMRLLGAGPTTQIKAIGVAGIIQNTVPVPILVLHPTLPGALSLGGTPAITICGGPQRSIQVNSTDSGAVSVGGTATIDLSKGGPSDTNGDCTTPGTGSDLGAFGGPPPPASTPPVPSWMYPSGGSPGSTEHYLEPSAPIGDPLKNIPYPPKPATPAPPPTPPPGAASGDYNQVGHGCTTGTSSKPCDLYHPGLYPSGIEVKNEIAIFSPGVYWIDDTGSKPNGFTGAANGTMMMCADCTADTSTHGTGNTGMLVYIHHNGTFNVGANGNASLLGSDFTSDYKGVLFFEDRNAPANTGSGSHTLGGGGNLTLTGTIYVTNCSTGDTGCTNAMSPTIYQNIRLRGNSGNTTLVKGEIVTSALDLGGGGTITMQLNPTNILLINKVALVR